MKKKRDRIDIFDLHDSIHCTGGGGRSRGVDIPRNANTTVRTTSILAYVFPVNRFVEFDAHCSVHGRSIRSRPTTENVFFFFRTLITRHVLFVQILWCPSSCTLIGTVWVHKPSKIWLRFFSVALCKGRTIALERPVAQGKVKRRTV